jgi:hypothetical protein
MHRSCLVTIPLSFSVDPACFNVLFYIGCLRSRSVPSMSLFPSITTSLPALARIVPSLTIAHNHPLVCVQPLRSSADQSYLPSHRPPWPSPSCDPSLPISLSVVSFVCSRVRPSILTLVDYILQLRKHYKPGRPAENAEEHGHYLDLVTYWQEQFRRTQDECDRLQSINVKLERSNQQLSQRMSTGLDERPSTVSNASKRRAASPVRTVKQPRASPSKALEHSVSQTQEAIENDYEFLEGFGDGKATRSPLLTALH